MVEETSPLIATGSLAGEGLVVKNLDVYYGHVRVLFETSLTVAKGESLALLGTNGAGKSTLLKAVAGLVAPQAGTIHYQGDDLRSRSAEQRVRAGVGLVSGGKAVFRSMSVHDNLRVGTFSLAGGDQARRDRVASVLDIFPTLRPLLKRRAGLCSGGEQQQLAIAKAMLLDPDLLMIDELSLGLSPIIVGDLLEVVNRLRGLGKTLLIVEQSLNLAMHLAERAVFMEKGRVSFQGPIRELQDRDDIARAVFLGRA